MSVKTQLVELAKQVKVLEEKVNAYEDATHANAQERYEALIIQQRILFTMANNILASSQKAKDAFDLVQAFANAGLGA